MLLIKDALLINEGKRVNASVCIDNERIVKIYTDNHIPFSGHFQRIIDAKGKYLIPGVIDDQVHFREPGLTHKADIESESRAAVAGGVTTYMDMPNTKPQTVTADDLEWKRDRAAQYSRANYAFYIGANNSNIDELKKIDASKICGVKVFMGSSTGNMLVDNPTTLERIFGELPYLIAVHCEEESIIQANIAHYKSLYGDNLPVNMHPLIRSEEACYVSSSKAVELAERKNARLHLLHLSTARELSLLDDLPLSEKHITGEVCVHHLWFNDSDYERFGTRIKWNPAIKKESDRRALMAAVNTNRLDVIATDHAPHLLKEKEGNCLTAASGGPLIQYSLLVMLEEMDHGNISLEQVVQKMCHAPASLFQIKERGFIREGYYADLVLIDPQQRTCVDTTHILSKCGWSPFEGYCFGNQIDTTFVNGQIVYQNGQVNDEIRGMAVEFER